MKTINFKEQKFIIIGAGETGQSIYRYLTFKQAQILAVLDTRKTPPAFLTGVPVVGGELKYDNLGRADVIVISPGVSIYEPALQQALANGKLVVGDIELFAQAIKAWNSKVIGITGSNGKTTVTSLTGYLASEVGIKTLVAGNIGKQVLDAFIEIESAKNYPELIVLEISSFQLETTYSLELDSATVLNISEDHLDRYRDLLEYAYAKSNIFNHSKVQVINKDDPMVLAMLRTNQRHIFFAQSGAEYELCESNEDTMLRINNQDFLNAKELMLVGRHNYLNSLASLALLAAAGYKIDQFKAPLIAFSGLEHRMQKVILHNDVLFIEDSKGTNVGAVIAGVGGINRPVHLILGGDGKGQDFTPLRSLVERKCKSVAVIGQDSPAILEVLAGLSNIEYYKTLEDAVKACVENAVAGDAVILSPACASWDMFNNYKHRAQVFVDSVYAAIQKNG